MTGASLVLVRLTPRYLVGSLSRTIGRNVNHLLGGNGNGSMEPCGWHVGQPGPGRLDPSGDF
jgi:hypothetical protein